MTSKHMLNKDSPKDYLIQKKVPKSLQSRFDEWKELRSLPYGKEARSQIGNVILDIILEETSLFDKEMVEKVNNLFIEGTLKEKLHFIVDRFFEVDTKFPYLTVQRAITSEDAGFPSCPFVKALYWKDEFLGFHCRAIKPPAFKLATIKVGRLSFQVTTPEDCWDCIKLCKLNKVGVDLFNHISIKQIDKKKEQIRLRKETKSEYETAITKKLQQEGMRMTYPEAKAIFENLSYVEDTKTWKGISRASKVTGTSRPSIYKLTKIFPKGFR